MSKFKPQYARLLFIDRQIRSGRYPNCTAMAGEYEVTPRTISRDIEYMRDMFGAPVEYDKKRRGYCYAEPKYHLPTLDIKESDFFAICIAQKALEQYENTPIHAPLSRVFDRILAFLPESIRVNTSWIDTRYTFMQESSTLINPEIWETVSNALRMRRRVRIEHQSPGSGPTERLVDPYHMASYRGEWYLVGYCHHRAQVLKFAMSRVRAAELTDASFEPPADFDFEKYMGPHFGIMTGEEAAVDIWFSPSQAPYVKERVWHSTQVIRDNPDGSIVLSLTTNSLFELKRWILSWGQDARVLKPESLAVEIRGDLARTLDGYGG